MTRSTRMLLPGIYLVFSMAVVLAMPDTSSGQNANATAPVPTAPMPAGISQSLGSLADQPGTHTGFIFDRSMLQIARNMLQLDDPATRRDAASISSIAYDNYHYPEAAFYNPQTMGTINAAYESAGWKHLVNGHEHSGNVAPRHTTSTDLWLHFSGSDVDGVTVLTRGSRDMNLIQVACDLNPVELLHLAGHFGIPKIDPSAVMVPAPDNR